MVSTSRTEEIAEGIGSDTIDYATVAMEEWLQVSFLMLFHNNESHIELPLVYGGGVYHLHACVELVQPAEQTKLLKEKQ